MLLSILQCIGQPHHAELSKTSMVPTTRTLFLFESKADVVLQTIQHLDRQGNTAETVKVWLRPKEDEGK